MKIRKWIAITLAVLSAFAFTACGNNQKTGATKAETETSEKPITEAPVGVFITYGEDGAYAFVDVETNSVFTAELPLDHMKDKEGNVLKFEDLKDGDQLQFNEMCIRDRYPFEKQEINHNCSAYDHAVSMC